MWLFRDFDHNVVDILSEYQFYSYYTMTVMMADVVPADWLYVYYYIFCLWSEFNSALLINVIVSKTVQKTYLVTLMFREV